MADQTKEKEILQSFHTVSSYEMDSFGHVNNAVFLNYLEKARCDYMTLKNLRFDDFFKWRKYPVVISARLEYKHPAAAGDKLVINGWITHHSQTSFTLEYEIVNLNNNKIVLTGETRHVFVDDDNRPSRIPVEFAQKFLTE